jgi:hypothetical protein
MLWDLLALLHGVVVAHLLFLNRADIVFERHLD